MLLSWDCHVLARTIWAEARGESTVGQLAVCHVILNRLGDHRWPSNVAAICLQPEQFSAWNAHDPNRAKVLIASDDDLAEHYVMASMLLNGDGTEDPTKGCNHYLVTGTQASWADGRTPDIIIGKHSFLKL